MNIKDIEEIVWKILERIFPKGYDIDAKLVEDLRVILTHHHEAEVEKAVEEIKEHCRKNIKIHQHILDEYDVAPFDWHRGRKIEAEETLEFIEALTPTKTDNQ